MRKLILYIAASLDGYIARVDGSIDWLDPSAATLTSDAGYAKLCSQIDTVLLGKQTYDQITTELSPNHWFYEAMLTYVWTHEHREDTHNIKFIDTDPVAFLQQLKQQDGKDIWLNGGAGIIHPLLREKLVDELQLTILPISLGQGIPLFPSQELHYTLTQLVSEGDVMMATYQII